MLRIDAPVFQLRYLGSFLPPVLSHLLTPDLTDPCQYVIPSGTVGYRFVVDCDRQVLRTVVCVRAGKKHRQGSGQVRARRLESPLIKAVCVIGFCRILRLVIIGPHIQRSCWRACREG